jgi:iron complex transport system permease protein
MVLEVKERARRTVRQWPPYQIYGVLLLLLILAGFLSLSLGTMTISPGQISSVLASKFGFVLPWGFEEGHAQVVWMLRLPRMFLSVLVGSSLAMAGAALQGIFRNPLADPALIGVSSGAALAAAFIIVLTPAWLMSLDGNFRYFIIPIAAFLGGMTTTWIVYRLATYDGRTSVATMLLAGIALNALCGAGVGILTYISDDVALRSLITWSLGSLSSSSWTVVSVVTPFVLVSAWLLRFEAKNLNLLLLGESEAFHLGVDLRRLKLKVILLSALTVGAAVGFTGLIGFIGLVVPHIIRLLWGPDHRTLLPASAILGAVVLLFSDVLSRTLVSPSELPIGIVSAFLGAPFFLFLMVHHLHREVQ